MAIYHEDLVNIELQTGTVHRSFLMHSIGSADSAANRFGVRVFRNGEEVDLTGCTCQGFFRNSNGENIALTSAGTVDGNVAYVTLPQACYNYAGQFCLAIKLIGGGVTGTVRIVDGMVDNTNTGGAVAPTETVPTYQEILATYGDMVDIVEDYEEVVANQDAQISDLKSAINTYTNPVINHANIFGDPCCKDTNTYSGTSQAYYKKWKTASYSLVNGIGTDYGDAYYWDTDGTNKVYLMQDFFPSDIPTGTYYFSFLVKCNFTEQNPSLSGNYSVIGYPTINNSSGTSLVNSGTVTYSNITLAGQNYHRYSGTIVIPDTSTYNHIRFSLYFNTSTLDIWLCEPYLSTVDSSFSLIENNFEEVGKTINAINAKISSRLYGKSLYIDGDSIAYGAGADGVSYGDLLATKYSMTLNKQAVSGGTMGYVANKHCIANSVVSNYNSEDYVILDGGFNDLGSSVPIGAFPTSVEQPLTPSPDTTTFIGAMQVAFQHIMNTHPTAKIWFLIPHRIYKSYTKPSGTLGLTFADYVNAIRSVCNRYGVEILDVYDNVNFNTYLDIYKPFTQNSDTVHPTLEGYQKFYMPYIEKVTN